MLRQNLKRAAAAITTTGITSAALFYTWTRHCHWNHLEANDSLLHSAEFRKYNPQRNRTFADVCYRDVSLSQIEPSLCEDAFKGGSQLVERFCGGLWGGRGYYLQRSIFGYMFRSKPGRSKELWDAPELLSSQYGPGTMICDHFKVTSKTPESIMLRGGESPITSTDVPRDLDSLLEVTVKVDHEKGIARVGLKSAMFQGAPITVLQKLPMESFDFLHRRYVKILVETALLNIRNR